MSAAWLKFFGWRGETAGEVVDVALAFQQGYPLALAGLVIAAAAAFSAWWYRRKLVELPRGRRIALAALRFFFLLLALAILLQPALRFNVEGSVRRSLVILLDASASMKIKDPRRQETDLKRAAIAVGALAPAAGLQAPLKNPPPRGIEQISRADLVRAVLTNAQLRLLPRLARDFDLSVFQFGSRLAEMANEGPSARAARDQSAPAPAPAWLERFAAEGSRTALGDAVREVLLRQRGQPVSGIFVLTDGANNSGISPLASAAVAQQERVPLYVYGTGLTSPPDIIVGGIFSPEVAFLQDEVPVTVRLKAQGMKGRSARLTLRLGNERVDEKQVVFEQDGEVTVPMKFLPARIGDFELSATAEPQADETLADNNRRAQPVRIIDAKIKVLLVEQSPRWEYRYLHALLLRDRRVALRVVLFEGDPNIARGPGTPYLERFPAQKEELFQYDLLIIGDVDPRNLSAAQQENIAEFVARFGGSVIMLAGKRFNPGQYRRTIFEKLAPVDFDAAGVELAGDVMSPNPTRVELTGPGRASPMLRLADTEAESARQWQQFPGVYWLARVGAAKPAAEVLVVDPDPRKESKSGKMPVVASHQYGLGQVLFLGTDNLWRWRRNSGENVHRQLWSQLTQRMALQHLLGGAKRTQLTTDRQSYHTGDRIAIFARLYSSAFEPVTQRIVRGTLAHRAGSGSGNFSPARSEVPLRAVPEQPGIYRGEWVAAAPGTFRFSVETDPGTTLDLTVTEPMFEFGESAMNEALLRQMAQESGGEFFREEDLQRLPEVIRARTERFRVPYEVELWSSPFYFLAMLGTLGAEWATRKLSQLK